MSRDVLQYAPAVEEENIHVITVHLLSFFGDSGICQKHIKNLCIRIDYSIKTENFINSEYVYKKSKKKRGIP